MEQAVEQVVEQVVEQAEGQVVEQVVEQVVGRAVERAQKVHQGTCQWQLQRSFVPDTGFWARRVQERVVGREQQTCSCCSLA